MCVCVEAHCASGYLAVGAISVVVVVESSIVDHGRYVRVFMLDGTETKFFNCKKLQTQNITALVH